MLPQRRQWCRRAKKLKTVVHVGVVQQEAVESGCEQVSFLVTTSICTSRFSAAQVVVVSEEMVRDRVLEVDPRIPAWHRAVVDRVLVC